MRSSNRFILRLTSVVVFILMMTNLILLDIVVVSYKSQDRTLVETVQVKRQEFKEEKASQIVCDAVCIEKIYGAIYEATASVRLASQGQSSLEFYIPLGSGSNTTDDWVDVTGVAAYIDSTQYGRVKKIVFEALVQVPNGNQTAYVRLYNDTDKHPVWGSEMSWEGGESKFLVSPSLTLGQGNKLYKVQMKSQLKDKTNLLQARVRITTY